MGPGLSPQALSREPVVATEPSGPQEASGQWAPSLALCPLETSHCTASETSLPPRSPFSALPGSPGLPRSLCQNQVLPPPGSTAPGGPWFSPGHPAGCSVYVKVSRPGRAPRDEGRACPHYAPSFPSRESALGLAQCEPLDLWNGCGRTGEVRVGGVSGGAGRCRSTMAGGPPGCLLEHQEARRLKVRGG